MYNIDNLFLAAPVPKRRTRYILVSWGISAFIYSNSFFDFSGFPFNRNGIHLGQCRPTSCWYLRYNSFTRLLFLFRTAYFQVLHSFLGWILEPQLGMDWRHSHTLWRGSAGHEYWWHMAAGIVHGARKYFAPEVYYSHSITHSSLFNYSLLPLDSMENLVQIWLDLHRAGAIL